MLQNQHGAGKSAKRWDRTGLVLDDLGHNKYRVKVDGSGRVTDRNRQYLRQFTPVTQVQPGPTPVYHQPVADPEPPITLPQSPIPATSNPEPVISIPEPVVSIPEPVVSVPEPQTLTPSPPQPVAQPATPGSPSFVTPPSTPVTTIPRRSTRVSKKPDRFGYDKF